MDMLKIPSVLKQVGIFLIAIKEYKIQVKVYTDFLPGFIKNNVKRTGLNYLVGNYKIPSTLCVTADTLFITRKGVLPLKDLQVGDEVITHKGTFKPVTHITSLGYKKITTVKTANGLELNTNKHHPYKVGKRWLPANKLVVDMELYVAYDKEEWKPHYLKEFKQYSVSSLGRVSGVKVKFISQQTDESFRNKVTLKQLQHELGEPATRKNGGIKDFRIARLMMLTFHGKSEKLVAHSNDMQVNILNNLRFATPKENAYDRVRTHGSSQRTSKRTKLDAIKVKFIRDNPNKLTLKQLAEKFKVSSRLIDLVIKNLRWKKRPKRIKKRLEFKKSRIVSVEINKNKQEVFGVGIADHNSHVTNGIVTHNSGRPTCSNVNLLNLPSSGTPLASPIKRCFVAPKGRCIMGADYAGQELMANALITKDPVMEKEFASGLDGHAARAVKYFPEKLPKDLVAKLNFIHKHGDARKYYVDKDNNLVIKELL